MDVVEQDELEGELIYTYIPDQQCERVRVMDDIAEEYRVYSNPEAANGIVVYAKYNGQWAANPWSVRCLISHMIKRIEDIDFWKDIVLTEDGKLDVSQVEKELADYHFLIEQVPLVYMHVTGEMLSKTNYYAYSVISAFDDYISRLIKEATEDAVSEYRASVEKLTKKISDCLHPDGAGPEKPSLCDVTVYVKHDTSRMRDFIQELADEPCTYGDNCPDFGSRHGQCIHCQCREILSEIGYGKKNEP